MFPPGRAKLAMRPSPTGSMLPASMTMGIFVVAALAACIGAGPITTMTSTFISASSAAMAGRRSRSPSANRCSNIKFRRSSKPSSRRPCSNACLCGLIESGPALSTPTRYSLPACCACAVSGHATAALPTSVMNSRRLMAPPSADSYTVPHR